MSLGDKEWGVPCDMACDAFKDMSADRDELLTEYNALLERVNGDSVAPMTDTREDALRRLHEAATPAPWLNTEGVIHTPEWDGDRWHDGCVAYCFTTDADAELTEALRNAYADGTLVAAEDCRKRELDSFHAGYAKGEQVAEGYWRRIAEWLATDWARSTASRDPARWQGKQGVVTWVRDWADARIGEAKSHVESDTDLSTPSTHERYSALVEAARAANTALNDMLDQYADKVGFDAPHAEANRRWLALDATLKEADHE